MKITHVETYPVEIPIKPERWMISSLGQHRVSRYLLVRVLTDEGLEGAGEATVTARWSGETVWSAQSLIERVLAPVVIGCDATDIAEIDRRMDAAWPLTTGSPKAPSRWPAGTFVGKAAGKPVYELLGGAVPTAHRAQPLQHGRLRARAGGGPGQGTGGGGVYDDQGESRHRPGSGRDARAGCARGDRPRNRTDDRRQLRLGRR